MVSQTDNLTIPLISISERIALWFQWYHARLNENNEQFGKNVVVDHHTPDRSFS